MGFLVACARPEKERCRYRTTAAARGIAPFPRRMAHHADTKAPGQPRPCAENGAGDTPAAEPHGPGAAPQGMKVPVARADDW